ncbi:hypothetical protein CCZ01_04480 [Helicobacter monodelphidis]|uniref:hypothetical protein n=1 Tax=Helicobacter sp. 15-1451 TaxID=2004995 RepID=UPI000DCDE4A1|nr:hypothetical protein [Helicobacter sp. 15-1451]RAX57890.1 hypothetical protein CCZ01_04480 [Helicobacter sp. 15-1451]
MRYRLIMFGFSAMCEDLGEVSLRLRGIPMQRADLEGIDQCYLVDLQKKRQYKIALIKGEYQVMFDSYEDL